VGNEAKKEGPQHLPFSANLSEHLKTIGIELIRLKTGTPPRVLKNSINYKIIQKEPGTDEKLCFDYFKQTYLPIKQQALCYLTYTNAKTHKIIKDNIHRSAMYSGKIKGVGPRYCPSIEDKVIRFHDKPRHQLFIEPESKQLDTVYIQGLSTSFPKEVQDKIVHSIKGLEKAKIINYAYAIEYDAINPVQLWPTLETKLIKNLYFAGQVNGTSGYEEAAGQGLLAGINVICSLKKFEPVILKRDQAYIGVMIDDLVTKGINDPYRLLTSRAEHRLLLRNDNADDRLIHIGYKIGLISKINYQRHQQQKKTIAEVIKYLKDNSLHAKKELTRKFGNSVHDLYTLLKRPEVTLRDILSSAQYKKLNNTTVAKIEILVKFDGYIKNQEKYIDKFNKYEEISLAGIKDYKKMTNLSLEAQDKLNKIKPLTLAQAQRISGINMTDLMIIKYFIDNNNR
jgi:tRNA uridine 5-carboxymethylaminomethyl modification enzyme